MRSDTIHPSIPSATVPEGLGINIHFTQELEGEMAMLAATQVKWIRMDWGWGRTEREKGVYDFSEPDKLVATLEKHNLRAIFILSYGNKLYSPVSPATQESRDAFVRWAVAAVTRYKGRGILWEIWNEPNLFWTPAINHSDYITLALATGKAIKTAAPEEAIIGPAMARFDWPFFEACFQSGLLEYLDAVSVHPYRNTAPDTAAPDYAKLQALISQYSPHGKTIPILSGEWGYSSADGRLTEKQQASYLQRMWLMNLSQGIPLSIWYDWRDDGDDPKESEHRYGLVRRAHFPKRAQPFDAKPAYFAAQKLIRELDGFRFAKRLDIGQADDWILVFRKENQIKIAAWTPDRKGREIAIPLSIIKPGEHDEHEVLKMRLSPVVAYIHP